MGSQATFISFPLNPVKDFVETPIPYFNEILERRMTVVMRTVVSDKQKKPIRSITVRYVDPVFFSNSI